MTFRWATRRELGMERPLGDDVHRLVHQYLHSLWRAGVRQIGRPGDMSFAAPVDPLMARLDSGSTRESSVAAATAPADSSSSLVSDVPTLLRPAASPLPPPTAPLLSGDDRMARPAPKKSTRATKSDVAGPTISPVEVTSPTKLGPPMPAAQKRAALSSLCEVVRGCTRCPALVANRTQTVFGVGNVQTRLCFFGEAPGADEDRQGEPFVGRAGQLLDKIIEACSLRREEVYILNTVKCRPPDNRTPEPDEMENCRPYFEQQLEIIRPQFICCLGKTAATALFGAKPSLGQLRHKLHEWRWAQVAVTYHPAYLLRNPAAKKDTWEDMQMLMKAMGIEVKARRE